MEDMISQSAGDELVIAFASWREWEGWLASHHASSHGAWIKIAKRRSGIDSVTHDEALDVALCYGWIDGQRKRLDDTHFLQRFTPRRPQSKWSKRNRDKAKELIDQGRMKAAGLHQVELAQADGRWEAAYDGQRTARVPDDLMRELDANPPAQQFFKTLDSRNRYAILYRVQDAKRPETRARRIAEYVAMLAQGRKIYP